MYKNRLNLRNVAMIMACLAVTTLCASCKKNNGDDTLGIDKKLVGTWEYIDVAPDKSESMWRYSFSNDGKFSMYLVTAKVHAYKGTYKVENEKIYFTNIVFTKVGTNDSGNAEVYTQNIVDKTAEYKFAFITSIEYLKIPRVDNSAAYLDATKQISWGKTKASFNPDC